MLTVDGIKLDFKLTNLFYSENFVILDLRKKSIMLVRVVYLGLIFIIVKGTLTYFFKFVISRYQEFIY